MRQAMHVLETCAKRRGLHEITADVRAWVTRQDLSAGMLTLFCRHTSASLLIQENAAGAAGRDSAPPREIVLHLTGE